MLFQVLVYTGCVDLAAEKYIVNLWYCPGIELRTSRLVARRNVKHSAILKWHHLWNKPIDVMRDTQKPNTIISVIAQSSYTINFNVIVG